MPKITIDDKEISVEGGTNIIAAAQRLGIEVPHYCYHPGLSVAGACRMCLVEIEKMPKLQTGCSTLATEGMVIKTIAHSAKAKAAVQGVLELTLINHPLDCPVCDQAGECGLQDYYMKYGLYNSRMRDAKVKKEKKASALGPHVMLDQERCILCSRCVRFTHEITKTNEIGIFNRGDHSYIDVVNGRSLENNYSGNVVDICPVGALTDRDFRFQCRVWYLQESDSICPGCSTGCNIKIHFNVRRRHIAGGRRVQRLKPRFNEAVNQWWMCDEGRYAYPSIDENRITTPSARLAAAHQRMDWRDAIDQMALALREALAAYGPESVGVIASPQLTNEDLYLIKKLFVDVLGIAAVDYRMPPNRSAKNDDFLLRADRNPNTLGAHLIGLSPFGKEISTPRILEAAAGGRLQVLYVFSTDLVAVYGEAPIANMAAHVPLMIYQGTNHNRTSTLAHLVLPAAIYAEKNGTFTNYAGRVQHLKPAFAPLAEAMPDWKILCKLAQALGHDFRYADEEAIFEELANSQPAFAGITYAGIGSHGWPIEKERVLSFVTA
ncbi:MAG: molybdopterin-dependent oxidoreductase [Acidobacteria bacterium]|nr:molybdopterin-dependent oxidoreductase [Acidobacteriota bacterium]MBI3658314.1 molybdopterin-dependent oxidoreductase [Acidobacteriota bacterium]